MGSDYDKPGREQDAPESLGLRFTRDEAMALLSMCMLAPTPQDPAAESGLMKLAQACRACLDEDEIEVGIEVAPDDGEPGLQIDAV